jgi:hypothetical protein
MRQINFKSQSKKPDDFGALRLGVLAGENPRRELCDRKFAQATKNFNHGYTGTER